jgi:hypothetical protein
VPPSFTGVLVGSAVAHQGGKDLDGDFAAYLILTQQATATHCDRADRGQYRQAAGAIAEGLGGGLPGDPGFLT